MNLYEGTPASIEGLLARHGFLGVGESVTHVSRAGEGNMNRVLRVRTNMGSLILKQSAPFVAKYPDIPAPVDRDRAEAAFYHAVADTETGLGMPRLYCHIEAEHLLALEDFGNTFDYTSIYDSANPEQHLTNKEVGLLVDWLRVLHNLEPPAVFDNMAMRELNHAHIFDLPFREHPNAALRRRAAELGELYLTVRKGSLLHGDYYPGSWLYTSVGPMIIDPEFAFVGPPAFDFGVFWAHLVIAGFDDDQIDRMLLVRTPRDTDLSLMRAFAGVEIVRRLIGVAKLPRTASPEADAALLEKAAAMVLG